MRIRKLDYYVKSKYIASMLTLNFWERKHILSQESFLTYYG